MTDRLYIVTRRDLPPGDQAVQSVHAALAFAARYPDLRPLWAEGSLALLTVADEDALAKLLFLACHGEVQCALFREPDLGNALTAVALEPGAKTLVRSLRLALQ